MSQPSRLALSIGATGPTKVFAGVVATFMIVGGAGFALISYGFALVARTTVNSSIGDGSYHRDENGNLVPGSAGAGELADGISSIAALGGVACGGVVALFAAYVLLRVLRTSAWLDGTGLSVRGAFITRSVDLATAVVSGGSELRAVGTGGHRSYHRVQTLSAADPRSGSSVKLPLRGAGLAMLPAAQLNALADAVTTGRTRSEATEGNFVVADRLRDFARDPFA